MVSAARDAADGARYDLELTNGGGRVPATLLLPRTRRPVPGALLLHGFGSRKERMADTVGVALARHRIAALAIDLPRHGQRDASDHLKSSTQLSGAWSSAVDEARVALQFLSGQREVDACRLAVVGYSLGSFLANVVAADSPNVRALVLAAAGDLPAGLPYESLVRAVVDPLRAVRLAAGRPLLMINGRFDRSVRPSQAERLFAAAQEPKTMRWYGGGHWPPEEEIRFAADWLAKALRLRGRARRLA